MASQRDEEDREEAKRLIQLPRAEQRAIVEMIGSPALDPKVNDEDRKEARRRARVLTRLLKLKPTKRPPQP